MYISAAYQLKPGNPNPDLMNWDPALKAQSLAAWHAGKPSLEDSAVTGIAYAVSPLLT